MSNSHFEFRVLSGLQAGARILLTPGGYTIGSELDCDIVLQGQDIEALHLELDIDESGIVLRPVAGECSAGGRIVSSALLLDAGQLFRAARIWMQVAQVGTAWPDAQAILAMEVVVESDLASPEQDTTIENADDTNPAETPSQTIAPDEVAEIAERVESERTTPVTSLQGNSETSFDAKTVDDETIDPTMEGTNSETAATKSRKRVGALSASMLAAVLLGGIAISLVTPGSAGSAKPSTSNSNNTASIEKATACVTGVAEMLGLKKKIDIVKEDDGQVAATGYIARARDLEQLQKKMAAQCPMVQVSVWADETLAQKVTTLLIRQGGHWNLKSVQQGRAVVSRVDTKGQPMSELRANVLKEISGVTEVEQMAFDLAVVKRQLETMLEQAQLAPRISAKVTTDRLLVTGDPTSAELARWTPLLDQLRQKYGADLPVSVEFQNRRSALPFQIRSVVGGKVPFIVIDDGSRLFEGGTYEGYQLVSIKDHQLVFGGKQQVEISW